MAQAAAIAEKEIPSPNVGTEKPFIVVEEEPVFSESAAWEPIGEGWKPLHGRFAQDGVSVEWHEFHVDEPIDWGASFHPQSLEICLNLAGNAKVTHGKQSLSIGPRSLAFYCVGDKPLQATRLAGSSKHEFLTMELGIDALADSLGTGTAQVHPLIARALTKGGFSTGLGHLSSMYVEQDRWVKQLLNPPVPQAAEALWIKSRVQEILAQCLFNQPKAELFCDRQKNIARGRVDRAIEVLRENLSEPPSLEELGRRVGCSQYYLSRTFSKETGSTIQQYLRRLRMERAAELLKSGQFNVTEAALDVGYTSMSHFSQAFCHEMGECPALFQKSTPAS
ncbi:MAG: hypothetical protein CMO80_06620 [Verrucomicrobiales bacterium]|nr:hypothetical protein [Verrucomicrobiales bacterium]|tara:strand:+ start:8230 stop:9237 length:1008 start_codon:yes stop_codon:yes gene_type:complete